MDFAVGKIIEDIDEEIGVLKIKEQAQVNDNAEHQETLRESLLLPVVINGIGDDKIHDGGKHNDEKIISAGLVKKVKREECKHQHTHPFMLICKLVEKQEHGKKHQEKAAIEQQRARRVIRQLAQDFVKVKIDHNVFIIRGLNAPEYRHPGVLQTRGFPAAHSLCG